MPNVELIYSLDCPNIEKARAAILQAFSRLKLTPRWKEWDQASSESPSYVKEYGSPTILVEGHDIADASPSSDADCCRIYKDNEGKLSGVPAVEMITLALKKNGGQIPVQKNTWVGGLTALPAIGSVLLPKLTCPLCWPAYASLLSALGLGFIDYTPYLFPITAFMLAISIASIGFYSKKKENYIPFFVSIGAAVLVLISKFWWLNNWGTYIGITGLVIASVWNLLPRGRKKSCPACP